MRGAARLRRGTSVIVVSVALIIAAGCSSSSDEARPPAAALSVTGGHASIGALTITHAYIPDPATPSIAAAYFTVTNSGPADRLLSVETPNFRSAALNHYVTHPGGAQSMAASSGAIIPAHGRLVLRPGSYHVMLMAPRHRLALGTTARLRLHFANAGVVSMVVPVVAYTGLPAATPSTQDMPGMNMSG